MGAARRGTAPKKRHGRGWCKQRDPRTATWARRKASSATYCRGSGVGTADAAPARPQAPAHS